MSIRDASESDVEGMVALSAAFRGQLHGYSPIFWREADGADQKQRVYFEVLLGLDDVLALVDTDGDHVCAFAIGRIMPAPPVYDPGGPICLIDDFAVDDAEWETRGDALLEAMDERARARGAVLTVVVCPRLANGKRGLLDRRGYEPTSEWHVREL